MARSRRIPGRLEAGVSLKAFVERKREGREEERERETERMRLGYEASKDSFVGNSSARRQRTLRRIALPLDIARIVLQALG